LGRLQVSAEAAATEKAARRTELATHVRWQSARERAAFKQEETPSAAPPGRTAGGSRLAHLSYNLPTNVEEEIEVESKRDLLAAFSSDVLADVSEEQQASILRASIASLKSGGWDSMHQSDRELFLQVLLICFHFCF